MPSFRRVGQRPTSDVVSSWLAPPATARTEAASFAGERHQALEGTALAPDAPEASAEHATRDEFAELTLDEPRKPVAIGAIGGLAQEGFQVLADNTMEDGARRVPRLIGEGAHGRRASEARAVRGSVGSGPALNSPANRNLDLKRDVPGSTRPRVVEDRFLAACPRGRVERRGRGRARLRGQLTAQYPSSTANRSRCQAASPNVFSATRARFR